jgi:hypothetical protein
MDVDRRSPDAVTRVGGAGRVLECEKGKPGESRFVPYPLPAWTLFEKVGTEAKVLDSKQYRHKYATCEGYRKQRWQMPQPATCLRSAAGIPNPSAVSCLAAANLQPALNPRLSRSAKPT